MTYDDISGFLDFIMNDEMQIIERDEHHIVIRQHDVCLEYQPRAGTGKFSTAAGDIDTFDYEDYLSQNRHDLEEWKQSFMQNQRAMVMNRIRNSAPYGEANYSNIH